MSSRNPQDMSLEKVKGVDKNGLSFTAYLLCNPVQRALLQSKDPIDLTGYEIVFQKIGDVSEKEHKDVLEFFEKTYLNKPLSEVAQ